ncbi:MAG: CRISPR-associated endonuclease Cas2 [Lachnospiraceae bacterium]
MNKFMRMIVFFDLPVVTARDRKAAAKFRKFLLKDGYHMMQLSVYTRVCNGVEAVEKHEARLNLNLPSKGSVRLLTLTEKQYESIHILLGEKTFDDTSESMELLNIF